MKIVLLSGGSGKRLWPLSNDARSKQFLKVLEDSEGQFVSMVQRVWGQLEQVGLAEYSVVATSKTQIDMIQSQLGTELPVIVEPERRDTYPAIALAASYLHSVGNVGQDEVVAILPVDSFVEDRFFTKVSELEQLLDKTGADLALVGVTPTYPSAKYGYIVPAADQESEEYIRVGRFQEKPSEAAAEDLIANKALWNCGVFAFRLGQMIELLEARGLPTDYQELLARYVELPKISFDYEVVEKAAHVVALAYDGYWKDLGTWNTLSEEMATQQIGKNVVSSECTNTHIINELDTPIVVLGINNAVVAASPDGILVSDKMASQRMKEHVSGFDMRPMFEERRWGWYRVLDHAFYEDGAEVLTKRIGVSAGKNLSYQLHYKRAEVWTIIRGEGEFVLDDVIYHVKPGDVLEIPVQAKHGIKATTDLEFIEVQTGAPLIESDIVRLCMTWEETVAVCDAKSAAQEVAAARK
ncbi:MAG: sugar phosphate nucleotidyltransferase [Tumebacillaceae bacterium]